MAWGATVPVEIAHYGVDGVLHGHSLTVQAWTEQGTCLSAWKARLAAAASRIDGHLEHTVMGRTFEDVAAAVLTALPEASRVVVSLPTGGVAVDVMRARAEENRV